MEIVIEIFGKLVYLVNFEKGINVVYKMLKIIEKI